MRQVALGFMKRMARIAVRKFVGDDDTAPSAEDPCGIVGLNDQAQIRQVAGFFIQLGAIDAFGVRASGIGADQQLHLISLFDAMSGSAHDLTIWSRGISSMATKADRAGKQSMAGTGSIAVGRNSLGKPLH